MPRVPRRKLSRELEQTLPFISGPFLCHIYPLLGDEADEWITRPRTDPERPSCGPLEACWRPGRTIIGEAGHRSTALVPRRELVANASSPSCRSCPRRRPGESSYPLKDRPVQLTRGGRGQMRRLLSQLGSLGSALERQRAERPNRRTGSRTGRSDAGWRACPRGTCGTLEFTKLSVFRT